MTEIVCQDKAILDSVYRDLLTELREVRADLKQPINLIRAATLKTGDIIMELDSPTVVYDPQVANQQAVEGVMAKFRLIRRP